METLNNYIHLPQAQQVHSMFPNIPLQAITLDLADTHSVSLTVDRVLNNTIYIPDQQQLQGEESTSSEPHPLTPSQVSSSNLHLPLCHGNLDGTGESSDQEASGISSESHTTSCTSSRDSSESPEHSTQSSSQSNESDNTHSDSSTLEEASGTLRRRAPRPTTDLTDSRYSSTADTSDARVDSTCSSGENTRRIGVVSSTPSTQTDSSGVELSARGGQEVSLPYVGVGFFNQHKPIAVGSNGGAGLGGVGRGSFTSLQQRKEEMLKKARQ